MFFPMNKPTAIETPFREMKKIINFMTVHTRLSSQQKNEEMVT